MSPVPSRSSLFPYTTLFRSEFRRMDRLSRHQNCCASVFATREMNASGVMFGSFQNCEIRSSTAPVSAGGDSISFAGTRSEEHTSELKSLRHLVCRLLLEKKK